MSVLIILLRAMSLLVFAGPMLLIAGRGQGNSEKRAGRKDGTRAPVVANFLAFALFFPLLLFFTHNIEASMPLALWGCLVALAGAVLVFRSRAELGAAWSLVPAADRQAGLIMTGPYRFVRHPIYSGLILVAAGQATAFGSWPAGVILLLGIIPTFAWRAAEEEKLLCGTFGELYAAYRQRTAMIIPHIL
jgi:protein-S-isoprenylcysteine O-methyltransferase Ste14